MSARDVVDLLKLAGIQSFPMALALVAVALFGRRLAEVLLKRMSELHRLELDKDLEAYKAHLERATRSLEVTFASLHKERFDAILQLAKTLDATETAMRHFVSFLGYTSDPPKEEQARLAAEAANKFLDSYYAHQVLFQKSTCTLIDEIAGKYREAFRDMEISVLDSPDIGLAPLDKTRLWEKAASVVTKEIPPLAERLRADFRELLGVESATPRPTPTPQENP